MCAVTCQKSISRRQMKKSQVLERNEWLHCCCCCSGCRVTRRSQNNSATTNSTTSRLRRMRNTHTRTSTGTLNTHTEIQWVILRRQNNANAAARSGCNEQLPAKENKKERKNQSASKKHCKVPSNEDKVLSAVAAHFDAGRLMAKRCSLRLFLKFFFLLLLHRQSKGRR